ncbi:MAG: BlaI/MecI/CopY family transcriptional regulator [Planctomycetota bacterium]|nr:MAG: BlaI/MecI/CopY family transcriptional regulator [Planctomycetota bacterium]
MAKRPACSKAELEIARLVWDLEGATVRQVLDALPGGRDLDYKTVQTYLRRLETKGYLKSRQDGRTRVYTPRVRPTQVISETVGDLVDRLFGGEALPLVEHLISAQRLSQEEIQRLRELIDDWEAKRHGNRK